ncbi:Protein MOR1 [Camellia lanceoleosa]|uniref:Protein MOR1 n=1 Tax=Camellia lanceoleosa TaxID=1840588 RepID=A0ACC0FSK1_9ERIC|nr:Protein MOR1 [Camellia lanceoleosa]
MPCLSGGNDASHSAEATARRGSSSFARPDVDMHSRSGMATLSTIGAVASAMGLAVEKSSKVSDITTALMDAKLGTEGRKDLFDWLSRQLSGLSCNGKLVESGQMGVLGNDENRIDKANLLVQFPSTSIDYIPQQQPFLAGNGKLVESGQMGVFGNDENRTDNANLLVQFPSTSIDYIPQQQPSLAGNGKSVESGQMGVLGNDENKIAKANLLVQFPSTFIDYIPRMTFFSASKGKSRVSPNGCFFLDEMMIIIGARLLSKEKK